MKKLGLFLGMIAFIAFTTSCETDTVEQDQPEFQGKTGEFNAEATYFDILSNIESGMTQFDALTTSQKQDVWVFKYNRFKNDNSLNALQVEVVDELLSFVNNVDFNEGDETLENTLESSVRELFSEEVSDFLLFSLENDFEDIVTPGDGYQTEGCFWCHDAIGPAGDCCAYRDSDGSIIDYRAPQDYRVRRFFIGWRTMHGWTSCDQTQWQNDGGSNCF